MRSKASLFLMEQLVMVLVFALCAALCLRVFAAADRISVETARRDQAVTVAQNAAELLKSGKSLAETQFGLTGNGYEVRIDPLPGEIPGLHQTQIAVWYEDALLFTLTTGWQEVAP